MTAGLGSSWFIGPFPHIAQRLPGGPFGSPSAIAPHFEAMDERSAAELMLAARDTVRAHIAARADSDDASIALNARLILILANHIGDRAVLTEALAAASKGDKS